MPGVHIVLDRKRSRLVANSLVIPQPRKPPLPQIALPGTSNSDLFLVERPTGRPGRRATMWVLTRPMELGRGKGSRAALGEKTEAEQIIDAAFARPDLSLSSPLPPSTKHRRESELTTLGTSTLATALGLEMNLITKDMQDKCAS